jgi:hypothetical protein
MKSEKFQNARDENKAEMAFFGEQCEQDAFRWCLQVVGCSYRQ